MAVLLFAATAGATPLEPGKVGHWSIERLPAPIEAVRAPGESEIELILDDGSREANLGLSDVAASQFLWLNQFEAPSPAAIDLTEIHVLFPPGPGIVPGADIQLVVYSDTDGDPTNGAELLRAFDDVIQVVDGSTFSVHPVDPPLRVPGTGDILIGVVNRFVESGVDPPSRPAALDTTSSFGRSWVGVWTGDPPAAPDLPPDLFLDTIDFLEPGNWMIRGVGRQPPVIAIPTLDRPGLAAVAIMLALAGALVMRRARISGQ